MADEANLLAVEFILDKKYNASKSAAMGRPIYDDEERVVIHFPGDMKRKVVAPVWETTLVNGEHVPYYIRFSHEYQMFKAGLQQKTSGTPLEAAHFLTPAKREELDWLKIRTVEQLAALDGQSLHRLGPGGMALRDEARAFLERAAKGVTVAQYDMMASRMAEMEAELRRYREREAAGQGVLGAEPVQPAEPVVQPPEQSAPPREPISMDGTTEEPPQPEQPAPPAINLDEMSVPQLKEFIKGQTGETPKGNPSRDSLMKMALLAAQRQGDEG